MSMTTYAFESRGLVIKVADSDREASEIGNYILDTAAEIEGITVEELLEDDWQGVADALPNCEYFHNDEQDYGDDMGLSMYRINADGSIDYCSCEDLTGEYLLFWLPGMDNVFGNPYATLDDVIAKYKELIGKYLPENFDYAASLGRLTGYTFG